MKKISCILVLLVVIYTPAHAEIFKCKLVSGKTLYQPAPCPSTTVHQGMIEVKKMDADKIAEAQARFSAWKADLAAREAAEKQAEKERREELARQESVEALKRSAIAQEELAEAAKRPVVINRVIQPYWPYLNAYPNQYPHPHPHQQPYPDRNHHGIDHKGQFNQHITPEHSWNHIRHQ